MPAGVGRGSGSLAPRRSRRSPNILPIHFFLLLTCNYYKNAQARRSAGLAMARWKGIKDS